jgi:hypothetical protein
MLYHFQEISDFSQNVFYTPAIFPFLKESDICFKGHNYSSGARYGGQL